MPFYSIAPGCLLVEAANAAAFPATGAANTIYIAQDTNTLYRWTGSAYVVVSASPEEVIEAANLAAFPATGEAGKLYVAADTGLAYRWTGTVYVEVSAAPVQSVAGKTGAVTLAKSDVGLGNVDNTSDANKPISTATQSALDGKATINNPTFTGTVAGITKSMVGLGDVDNTSDLSKPISTATQSALDAKALQPLVYFEYANANGTATEYAIPVGYKSADILLVGGGGGGGSGRTGNSGQRTGGSGGGGAAVTIASISIDSIPNRKLYITVGRGGAGGAAQTLPDYTGNSGATGETSSVMWDTTYINSFGSSDPGRIGLVANGGNGGNGGRLAASVTGGSGGIDGTIAGLAAHNSYANQSGFTQPPGVGCAGGGSGAGLDDVATRAGGRGAPPSKVLSAPSFYAHTEFGTASTPNGQNGKSGNLGTALPWIGSSGAGGAASKVANGGAGGDGAIGGGGGGGGAVNNGFTSGKGGKGGDGFIRIVFY